MRSRLFAVLLATTCLTPVAAHAEPVSAFIAGVTTAIGSLGVSGAAAIGSAVGGLAGAAFTAGAYSTLLFTTFLGRAVLGVGIAALAASQTPDISAPPPSARMGSFAQPLAFAEYVFGRTRKGGPLGFTGAASNRRYYVPILAAHPVEGVVQHWIDEWTVGVDPSVTNFDNSNLVTETPFTAHPSIGRDRGAVGRIDFFSGSSGQAANAGLVANFPEVTSDFDFARLAGAVLWARRVSPSGFSNVYPRGREWGYAPVIDGWNEIYDPRDGTTGYTNNAALCIAKWLTDVLGQRVDWDEVAVEADACDVVVDNAEGTTQPRWTINGSISSEQSFEAQRALMCGACDAFIYERTDGKVGFKVARWIAPTVTLTDADFEAVTISSGEFGPDAPAEVSVVYTEPANGWRETASGTIVASTEGETRDTPQIFTVTSHNQASRLAKRIVKARRPEWRLRGQVGLIGFELLSDSLGGVHRFFRFEHAGLGITSDFEIATIRRVGVAAFEIEAVSTSEADFDFDAAGEEPERPELDEVASAFVTPDVTGITATAANASAIEVAWDAQEDYLTQQVRWRPTGETVWQQATMSTEQTRFIIPGLVDGQVYDIQVRNVLPATLSNPSDWLPATPLQVTVVANSTPPSALADFAVAVDGSDITVSFQAPNDANYFASRIWRGTSATFGASSLVRTEYGIPSSGDAWTDPGLAAGTYYYWAAPINASGVEGPLAGPQSDTVV